MTAVEVVGGLAELQDEHKISWLMEFVTCSTFMMYGIYFEDMRNNE
jgi:hypothetical protein